MLKQAIPVLHVTDSAKAEAFYERMGFRREFAYRPSAASDPCYMGLARDDARLHLSSFAGDSVPGCAVYLTVDDVDVLYAELRRCDIAIELSPTDQTWGNREMYVRDEDKNSLRFIQSKQN